MQARKFIRSRATGAFFNNGKWVTDFRVAQELEDFAMVFQILIRYQLHDVELYYLFGDAPSEVFDWTISLG